LWRFTGKLIAYSSGHESLPLCHEVRRWRSVFLASVPASGLSDASFKHRCRGTLCWRSRCSRRTSGRVLRWSSRASRPCGCPQFSGLKRGGAARCPSDTEGSRTKIESPTDAKRYPIGTLRSPHRSRPIHLQSGGLPIDPSL